MHLYKWCIHCVFTSPDVLLVSAQIGINRYNRYLQFSKSKMHCKQ